MPGRRIRKRELGELKTAWLDHLYGAIRLGTIRQRIRLLLTGACQARRLIDLTSRRKRHSDGAAGRAQPWTASVTAYFARQDKVRRESPRRVIRSLHRTEAPARSKPTRISQRPHAIADCCLSNHSWSAGSLTTVAEISSPHKRRITARGAATRERIVVAANATMRARGVGSTTMDEVRAAAGVSTSQLYRHFPDKDALIAAVVEVRAARILDIQEQQLSRLKSIRGLERWRDVHIQMGVGSSVALGCEYGSIASELAGQYEYARLILEAGFQRWRTLLADGIRRMIDDGVLSSKAEPEALAVGLLAALQGGYLMAQSARDITLVKTAVNVAIDHVRAFAIPDAPQSAWVRLGFRRNDGGTVPLHSGHRQRVTHPLVFGRIGPIRPPGQRALLGELDAWHVVELIEQLDGVPQNEVPRSKDVRAIECPHQK